MIDALEFAEVDVGIAVSDHPDAGTQLEKFCRGETPAIVPVAMAYGGTDAPRLSHLCVLTHYRSKAWLHQLFARAWRCSPGVAYDDDYCVAFCPDDVRLCAVVDALKEEQQAGIRLAQDEVVRDGDHGAPKDIIVVEDGELTRLTNRFEFATTPASEVEPAVPNRQDPKVARWTLLGMGYSATQVDRMLAAAVDQPVPEELTLQDRIEEASQQLEAYQRKTAFALARATGVQVASAHFELVNRRLKELIGKERSAYDEPDDTAAIATHAPRVRR